MTGVSILCPVCKCEAVLPTGAVNRARLTGLNLYCGRKCAGIGRRKKPVAECVKRALKGAYDEEYRTRNRERLRAQKHERFRRTYDREVARVERQFRMAAHIEYCRRPAYKAYKQQYDRQYRAKQDFGDYWECAMLLGDVDTEIGARITRTEIYAQNGTQNKSLRRKRDYARIIGG